MTIQWLAPLTFISFSTLLLALPQGKSHPTIGSRTLSGGTEKLQFDTSAITNGHGKIVGRVLNGLEACTSGVTVSVVRIGDSATVPTNASGRIKATGAKGKRTDEAHTAFKVEAGSVIGYTCHLALKNIGELCSSKQVDFSIPIDDPGNGALIEIWLTPSCETAFGGDANVFESAKLTKSSPRAMGELADAAYARSAILVRNDSAAEVGSFAMIRGEVHHVADDITLVGAQLETLTRPPTVAPGMKVTITENTFELSGFASLDPGADYNLVLLHSAVPQSGCNVSLNATFD